MNTTDRDAASIVRELRQFAAMDFGASGDRAFETAALIESQKSAIDRVRALHKEVPVQFEEYSVCSECDGQSWPCGTILAVEGSPS